MGKIRNLKKLRPELFDDSSKVKYSYDKNEGINPERLELTNKDELWFIGTSCNHEFKTTIGNILRKDRENKCPYCEGKKILVGFNDLKTKYPSFFNGENKVQWNKEKNEEEGIKQENFAQSSLQDAWFTCNKNHIWKSKIVNIFNKKRGCPYCSHRKIEIGITDLRSCYPKIAKEWNYEKNDTVPENYSYASNKKVWWKTICDKYNKTWTLEWEDKIDSRTIQGNGCPYLTNKKVLEGFNDFKTWCIHNNKQDLLNEWDYEKNDNLKPEECLDGGTKYVWWKKTLYKNDKAFEVSWKALIRHRKLGVGDPYSSIPARSVLKGYNDLASCYPEVAKEWNYEKNGDLKPDNVLSQSNEKFWWKCNICGYEWQSSIVNRIKNKNKCPYCNKTQLILGLNDLASCYPDIAKEWNYEKNKNKPEDYRYASNEEVWWRLPVERYDKLWVLEWKDTIYGRTLMNNNCPYLNNKKVLNGFNDFKTWCLCNNQNLLKEWDYDKNKLKPENYSDTDSSIVWWSKIIYNENKSFNISWKSSIKNRKNGKGDPYTSSSSKHVLYQYNDLFSCYSNISNEWDYVNNDKLDPKQIHKHSHKKVWWKCKKCGNKWYSSVISRTLDGDGCPYCCSPPKKIKPGFNDFSSYAKKNDPELLLYINTKKNIADDIDINYLSYGSKKKVNLICPICGYEWKGSLEKLSGGCRCPKCNSSKGEKRISLFLDDKKIKYNQEYTFDDCVYVAKLRFDFAIFDKNNILTCLVEYDGEAHDKPISFGCKDKDEILKRFKQTKIRDYIKNEYCKKNKIPLIRIHYTKFNEIENILEEKFKELGLMS